MATNLVPSSDAISWTFSTPDGQLIICGDMLGMFEAFTPRFVKKYANVAEVMTNAFKEYIDDVKTEKFPEDKHVYHIKDSVENFKKLFIEFE